MTRRWWLENLDVFIGIAISAIVAILGVAGLASPSVLSAGVLAVLALLLSLILRLRTILTSLVAAHEREDQSLSYLREWLGNQGSASGVFRNDYPDIAEDIAGSMHIDIVAGLSLKTTVGRFYGHLERAARGGAKIRVVCPNPLNEELMKAAAQISVSKNLPTETASDVSMNLRMALRLQGICPPEGKIEARVVDTLPGAGIVTMKVAERTTTYVKLMLFGIGFGPVFSVVDTLDSELSLVFQEYFEALWNSSRRPRSVA